MTMEKELNTKAQVAEIEIDSVTGITPNNRDKEIKIEDLNMLIGGASEMYNNLALSIVQSLELLEIISPVVNKNTLESLEKKAKGLSVNLLALEKTVLEVKEDSDNIGKLLKEKEEKPEDQKVAYDFKLLPNFEQLIYKVGGLTKELEALSEYYLVNLKAPVDSLELNAKKKHEELTSTKEASKEEVTETVKAGRGHTLPIVQVDELAYITNDKGKENE